MNQQILPNVQLHCGHHCACLFVGCIVVSSSCLGHVLCVDFFSIRMAATFSVSPHFLGKVFRQSNGSHRAIRLHARQLSQKVRSLALARRRSVGMCKAFPLINVSMLYRSHILFLAAFDDNGSFLSQLNLLVMLCESFISSLTIYMPYYPVGTMERVLKEGEGCAQRMRVLDVSLFELRVFCLSELS